MAQLKKKMKNYITYDVLNQLQRDNSVEVLLAVESGSRMWGFASPDSDYDVRCITRHKDPFSYAAFGEKDHGSFEDMQTKVDAAYWDVKKALYFMCKGNGTVIEWLASPIVYAKNEEAAKLLEMLQLQLLKDDHILSGLCYHYRSLAWHALKEGEHRCGGDLSKFPLKKFLYAVRAAAMTTTYIAIRDGNLDANIIPSPLIEDCEFHLAGAYYFPKDEISRLIEIKKKSTETAFIDISKGASNAMYNALNTLVANTDTFRKADKSEMDFVLMNTILRSILSLPPKV